MRRVLIIPDAHLEPGHDLSRFEKAGQLIVDRQPDDIVILGDYVSLNSLSHWDRNKRLIMEHRRYEDDVEVGNEGLELLLAPMEATNLRHRKNKQKQYTPSLTFLAGNHEHWAHGYVEQHSELEGFISIPRDLRLFERGFDYVPYRYFKQIDNVTYCHSPMNKANQPIGGKYGVARALERHNNHIVFGHTHRWEQMGDKRIDSNFRNEAVTCGCFFSETPAYAQGADTAMWSGLTIAKHLDSGAITFEQISLEELECDYM